MSTYMNSLKISRREKEIIYLIVDEYNTKQIASALNIGFETVKTHRTRIREKLGVKSVAGIVREAFQRQLVS